MFTPCSFLDMFILASDVYVFSELYSLKYIPYIIPLIHFREAAMKKKLPYKDLVLEYLTGHKNEYIKRSDLISIIGISNSRLSEILKQIVQDGYTIDAPPRSGKVMLTSCNRTSIYASIKDNDIRQWLILLILSKYKRLTFNELLIKTLTLKDIDSDYTSILSYSDSNKKPYDNASLIKSLKNSKLYPSTQVDNTVAKEIISVTSLRSDLLDLRKNGLVRMEKSEHTTYSLSTAAPYIIPVSGDSLFQLCQRYSESATSTTKISPLKHAYEKIHSLINIEEYSISQLRYGKTNTITEKQISSFNSFVIHPYKTNLLCLSYEKDGSSTNVSFAVGLLFYSVETGCFYALGKNIDKSRIEARRIDWIHQVSPSKYENTEYHKDKYYKILSEMFSASYEDTVHHVKIAFQDYGNVMKRFSDLRKTREQAIIRPITAPPNELFTYIYEDNIRGMADFARYLRSFGTSVIALEPKELRDSMENTYKRIIEKYGEYHV